jgi:hypothetical protein
MRWSLGRFGKLEVFLNGGLHFRVRKIFLDPGHIETGVLGGCHRARLVGHAVVSTVTRARSLPRNALFTSCPATEAIYNDGEQDDHTDDKYLKERRHTGHVQCIRQ